MNALDAAVDALDIAKNCDLDEMAQRKCAEALASATIALAQEQKLANQIAVLQSGPSFLEDVLLGALRADWQIEQAVARNALRAQIREGLAL